MLLVLATVFRYYKRPVGSNWRMDETYVLVRGPVEVSLRGLPTVTAPRSTFC